METFFGSIAGDSLFRDDIALWLVYFPLGVVGAWRWSVWIFKKIISLFYRVPTGEYHATLSVVTPVYNEDPDMFWRALLSWKRNNPQEIIAVIDHTDEKCIEVFEKFQKICPEAKMIVTHTPGKREALADGIALSTCELVALVDSDTVWTRGLRKKITDPFWDKGVGGVAPRQDVIHADTLAKKLFRIHIYNRYGNDLIYQAAFGNALSCISGRTGVYRRSAIEHLTDELINESFLGKRCISGDDKRLTSLIQRDGWDVKYVHNALVYTPGSSDLSTYTKQQIRWTRNSWRSDLKALFSLWLWRNPFLAFHVMDRFVQPFTLLLGPIFLGIALYRKDWIVALILVCWWLVSRPIKIFGHLRKHPSDMLIIPVYIVYSFFLAIIKIYTLITVDEQTWITRWDKSRMRRFGFLKNVSAYAATFSVVFLIAFASYDASVSLSKEAADDLVYKNALLTQAKAEKRLVKIDDQSVLMTIKSQEAYQQEDILAQKVDMNSFGYYRMPLGWTLDDVKKKFFLRPDAVISVENTAPKTRFPLGSAALGNRVAISIDDLRNPDMELYRRNSSASFFLINNFEQNAIQVMGKGSFVTIDDLEKRINNPLVLERVGYKQFILRKNIFIGDGVTLIVDGADVRWLKLKSDQQGFAWLKSENGNIVIRGTKITSWDESKDDYDTNWEDGRSYILQKLSGRMDIYDSEIAYLGYFGSPNRGNPYGGPYGVSWKISNGSFRNELSTGTLVRSSVHHNLFGMYTYGVTGAVFSDNEIFYNVEYGMDPHDDSNHLLIESNKVYHNGNHGIIASKRCFSNIIRGNYSQNNRLHGIMLDRDSNNNLVENNYVSGNMNGMALYHSSENIVRNNNISGNVFGIRANNESKNNFFGGNVVASGQKGVYLYQNSSNNYIFQNKFFGNLTNVQLKQTSDAFFTKAEESEVLQARESAFVDFLNYVF